MTFAFVDLHHVPLLDEDPAEEFPGLPDDDIHEGM